MIRLRVEQLESRDTPTFVSAFGIVDPLGPGFDNVTEIGADVDGNHIADSVFIAGTGGDYRIRVLSGGDGHMVSTNPTDPNAPLIDEAMGKEIASFTVFNDWDRIGLSGAAVRSPDGTHDDIVVTPLVGGGPIAAIIDLSGAQPVVKTFEIYGDPNYRGGVHLTSLPPENGVGAPDALVLASALAGGGPRQEIFDASGNVVDNFFAGPEDDMSGLYQPVPYGTGVLAPDGSGKMVIEFSTPTGVNELLDYQGGVHADTTFNTPMQQLVFGS